MARTTRWGFQRTPAAFRVDARTASVTCPGTEGAGSLLETESITTTILPADMLMGHHKISPTRLNMVGRGGRGGRGGKKRTGGGGARGPPQRKVKDDVIVVNGKVVEALPNAMFRVEIEPSKAIALVTVSGKIRKNFVRIVIGDSVVVELSAYDLSRGRITYRNKA